MATITPSPDDRRRARYALSHPAADGGVVTQGHADYCADHGHATYTNDGVVAPWCARCGATMAQAPITEAFTDEHGRAAVRYITADVEAGIAAGSELLAMPAELAPVACTQCGNRCDPDNASAAICDDCDWRASQPKHVFSTSHFGGAIWCRTCDSTLCDLA